MARDYRTGAQWRTAGPPANRIVGNTNSFLYVPLLLDAAGLFESSVSEAWLRHPLSSEWWANALVLLRQNSKTVADIGAAIQFTVLGLDDPTTVQVVTNALASLAATAYDSSSRLHIGAAVRIFMDPSGYVHAIL